MKKSCVFRITEATFFVIEVDQSDYNNKQQKAKKKRRTHNLLATCCGETKKNRDPSLYFSISIPFSVKLSLKKKKKKRKRRTKSTTQPDCGTGKKKGRGGGRWGQDVHKLAHVRRHAEAESRRKESKSTPVYAKANQRRGR